MDKLKLTAGVILIFLVGAFAGSLGTGLYLRHGFNTHGREALGPHRKTDLIIRRLSDKLDLTESQRVEIGRIVKESYSELMTVNRQYLPKIKKNLDRRFELINEKIDSEQQKKLAKLKQKIDRHFARAFINSGIDGEKPKQGYNKP